MPLKSYNRIKHHNVTLKSGNMYNFKYAAYENDPTPTILFINAIKGLHPNTGHQWRLIQGINMSYIPRKDRKRFIEVWKNEMKKGSSMDITWKKIKSKYPYIQYGIRRYMLKPTYYMRNLRWISPEDWEKEVIKSWHKDFSSSLKRAIASKLKKFFTGKRRR